MQLKSDHHNPWPRWVCVSIVLLPLLKPCSNLECDISADPVFHGSFVDCSNREISRQDLHNLNFDHVNVTTLNISENNFEFFPNDSLERFGQLKHLICLSCALNRMSIDSLKGLNELEILNLSKNNLRLRFFAFPKGCFRHVLQLKELLIDFNNNDGEVDSYSPYIDIFYSLPNLTYLAIDSFNQLRIGAEFVNLTKLVSLKVNCDLLNRIENDSLEGFRDSSVRAFELVNGKNVFEIGLDVFQHLPNVSYLSLNAIRVGNQCVLRMMKPLKGRTIETMRFTTLYSSEFGNFDQKVLDGLVSVKSMEYFGSICVHNFFWLDSHLFAVESDAFLSPVWQNCLTQFAIQGNELIAADLILFFKLKLLKKIELLAYLTRGDGFLTQFISSSLYDIDMMSRAHTSCIHSNYDTHHEPLSFGDVKNSGHDRSINKNSNFIFKSSDIMSQKASNNEFQTDSEQDYDTRNEQHPPRNHSDKDADRSSQDPFHHVSRVTNREDLSQQNFNASLGKVIIYIPPTCKSFIIDGMHYLHDSIDFWFGPNSLTTLAATNSLDVTILHAKFYGLDSVSTINLKGTKIDIIPDFFDTFPSLKNLNLRGTAVRPKWLQANCKDLFAKIPSLENLDLADNFLQRLAPRTFYTNRNLKQLCLANNRFSNIPFSLTRTPKLEVLDLRGNSFVGLTKKDRTAIDQHIRLVPQFKILFDDNELSCTCSTLPFIVWLQSNLIHFDRNGNYSCIPEDGSLSHTANYRDIKAFWRKCHGKLFFFLSLIVAIALVLILIALKNQARIVNKIMQMAMPGFRMKTREDYAKDVCIGYADQDATFVRNVLLPYLEDEWHLRTFVHHRDLLQDWLRMSSHMNDSWKCLLLITKNFLFHYDMGPNVMKVASFFVGPTNPKRLIIVVEEEFEYYIPDYVMQVVNEDNILVVPQLQDPLNRETVEFLRSRLTC